MNPYFYNLSVICIAAFGIRVVVFGWKLWGYHDVDPMIRQLYLLSGKDLKPSMSPVWLIPAFLAALYLYTYSGVSS